MTPIRTICALLAGIALVVFTLSCGRRTAPTAEWTMAVQRVQSPAGANSSEPQIMSSDRGLLLSWVERSGKTSVLKSVERTGSGWSAPLTAASGDDWFLSYADVPSVMKMSDGTLVAQWLQTTDAIREAYNLRLSYSKDNGKTWSPSFLPHTDVSKSQHGFASLIELPGRGLGVIWLDGRNSEFDVDNPASATMELRYAAYDANWKPQTVDTEVDHRVCECCPTTAVMTPDGILTAFRDRSDDEVRDIAVSRLDNGKWTPAALISKDNWQIDFCPVNGPMLSARGRDVVAAWFTVKNDLGQAYAAFSSDAGKSWGMPIRLDDKGSLGRTDVEILEDGSAIASWVEYAEGKADFRFRRIDRTGARSAPVTVAPVTGGQSAGYPRIGLRGGELVFAWTDSAAGQDGALQLQTAVGNLP